MRENIVDEHADLIHENHNSANVIFDMNVFTVDFTKALKRFWYIPVVFALVLGTFFSYFKFVSYVPMYQSSVSFSVTAVSYTANGSSFSASYYDNVSAAQLSKTFPYIVNTTMMTNALKEELGTNYVNGTISAEAVATDSNIFKVTVDSNSAEDSFKIINAIIEVYPEVSSFVVGNVNLNILIKPTLPAAPYTTNNFIRIGAIMALVGATAGLFFIGVFAFFRNTVRKKEDFKNKLNQKCFVEVPVVVFHRKSNDKNIADRLVRITDKHPTYKEAFRLLRKRLMRNLKQEEKIVGITAAAFAEGKTTVAFNLAHAMSISGKKIACVDFDFNVRSLQRYLNSEQKQGISDFVALSDSEYQKYSVSIEDKLDVFFAGNSKIDFIHTDFSDFISFLRQNYDTVIINLPSGNDVSSSVSGSNLCDCVLLVVKQDKTSIDKIRKTLESLSFSSAKILGFVFNCVQDGFSGYGGYYYGGRYGYGKYGYGKYGYGRYGYGRYGYGYGKEHTYGYGYGYGYGEDDEHQHSKKHGKSKKKDEFDINSLPDSDIPDNIN